MVKFGLDVLWGLRDACASKNKNGLTTKRRKRHNYAFIIIYLLFFLQYFNFSYLFVSCTDARNLLVFRPHILKFWNFKILLIFVIFEVRWRRQGFHHHRRRPINQPIIQMQSSLLHTLSLSLNVQVVGEIKKFCKNFGSFKFVLLKKFLSYICLNF